MFAKFSVKKPVTITMLILVVIVFGFVSLSKLKVELMPSIEMPIAIVQTTYTGVGPEEMENLVTKPLEQALLSVENIDSVSSFSNEGSSLMLIQFNFGTDMDTATLDMREKLDLIRGSLPDGASAPIVMKMDPNSMPIVQLAISGKGQDIYTTQKIAEDIIQPRLERIEGAASADISGGLEKEITIVLSEETLKGYGLSFSYIGQIIQAENLNYPGGNVKKGSNELVVRTVGEFESIEDVKNLSIPLPAGGIIRLKDVAEVSLTDKDRTSIAKLDGQSVVQISIMKQSDGNTVDVSKSVNEELAKIRSEYPNLDIVVVTDQADYINLSINNLLSTALQGCILAVIILFIFLRSFKTTIIIAISIPFSIITTFVILYFSKINLNMMTLGGLALGIGMLVDNSIVVLENIFRHRSLGLDKQSASIEGANEVSMAVTASTLTSVAVFLPFIFTEGIVSMMFKDFAATIVVSLLSSLIVALTMIPMLSSKLVTVKKIKSEEEQEKESGFITNIYKKIIAWALRHRLIVITASLLIFILSISAFASNGAELFPEMDEGTLTVDVVMPEGTNLDETDKILSEIQQLALQIPEVEYVFASAGSSGLSLGSSGGTGSVTLTLVDLEERERSASEISEKIRTAVKDIPGAEINVSSSSSMSMSTSDISLLVTGDNIETLKSIGNDIKDIIDSIEGSRDVETSLEDGTPRVQIDVDRGMASQYGLTASQIGSAVRTALTGQEISTYKVDGDEFDIVLKGDSIYESSLTMLEMIPVSTNSGGTVPLSEVADIKTVEGPTSITRQDQKRSVTINASVFGRDVQSVTDEIEQKLNSYNMPDGYSYSFEGMTEQMNEAFSDLLLVMVVAVLLVYMIIAAQLESFTQPLIIMFSVPLALSGGLIGLYILDMPINMVGMIGAVILIGVVVNNAIVLVDYINSRIQNGEDTITAIMKAGPIRLRPIMMTTLTTVLGLVPMALGIGEGAEMSQQLGIVVIGGLSLSTLLTLIVIPVAYSLLDSLGKSLRSKFAKKPVSTAE